MSVLRNARHERFAQELAQGKTADESYQLAGFKANRGNACRLKAHESIENRVVELQRPVVVQLKEAALKRAVTTETLLAEADELLEAASSKEQYGAAVAALTAKAKLAGLWIEKQEAKVEQTSHVIERAPTATEWATEAAKESGGVAAPGRSTTPLN